MSELSQAQDNLAKINEKYEKSKQNVAEREREVKSLKKRIAELEKELTLDKVTSELKRVICDNIGQSITNQWEYIEAIYEQVALIGRARKEMQRARASLGGMPEIATKMIDVLNYRTSSQLVRMGIGNRTETISLIRRVLTLRNLIQTLE